MNEVSFGEEPTLGYATTKKSGFTAFIIGAGIAKTEKGAQTALLIIALLIIVAAIVILVYPSQRPEPPAPLGPNGMQLSTTHR